jgi:YHS domain-containing protein
MRGLAADEAPPAASATASAVKPQKKCPVMGGGVDKKFFADYQGKRVYFCCNACPAMFKKDPAKYIKKLEAEGITLDKTPRAATTNAPAAGPQGQEESKSDEHSGHQH